MSKSQNSGSGGGKKGDGFSKWLPNKWRKGVGSKVEENPISADRRKGKKRTTYISSTDFKDIFSGGGRGSYITKVEEKKKAEVVEKLVTGTIEWSGERESLYCPLKIVSLSENLIDVIECGPDSGPSFLEVCKTKPEFILRFSQGESKFVNFLFSELEDIPSINDKRCGVEFVFNDRDDGKKKWLKVEFKSRCQFLQIANSCRRYTEILGFKPETYEPELSDISKNLGCVVKSKRKPFHKKAVLTWESEDIKEWLKIVPFQEVKNEEITSLYDHIEEKKMFPKKMRKRSSVMIQSSAKGADFKRLHYDQLVKHFARVERKKEEEEVEGEGENDGKVTYLDTLFENERNLLETFKFEVKMMEGNSVVKGNPYFNYNFNKVLRKKCDEAEDAENISLISIRNKLFVEERHLWSVMDCVDYILSLMSYKMGTQEWIDEKECEFEDRKVKRPFGFSEKKEGGSIQSWIDWGKKLEEFNEKNGLRLERLSYNVWVDFYRKRHAETVDRITKEWREVLKKKKAARKSGDKKAELELRKKINELKKERADANENLKSFERASKDEEPIFLISKARRKCIQKHLLNQMIFRVKGGMFEMGVKTVLSLLPASEEEKFEDLFRGNITKLGLRFTKFFGKKPSFAKFGFCHSSITIVNVAIHWFSNSLMLVDNLKEKGSLYEEIIAMEAGCPTLVFKCIKPAYDLILKISEFIVNANVEYEYTFIGSFRDDGKNKKVNCQQVTVRLLKELEYTKYDPEVKTFIEDFISEYAKYGSTKPKNTENSRWLPLSKMGDFVEKFKKPILAFVKGNQVPDRIYFNSRKEVDVFTIDLMKEDHLFQVNHPGVYQLLKAFDRAFQIQGQGEGLFSPFTVGFQSK